MSEQELTTIEEKRAYVERITKKATDENITFKHAAQKLGCKVWSYYKYKAELHKLDTDRCRSETAISKNGTVEEHGQTLPISITISISDDVMAYLEKEASGYATDAGIVAQLLLHDCVRGKINGKPKES